MDISFSTSAGDRDLIEQIVDRAWGLNWLRQGYASRLDMIMDVVAVHANGAPLRLRDLLNADHFNFAHDMSGIGNCLDRGSGLLTNNFRPRFSAPSEAA